MSLFQNIQHHAKRSGGTATYSIIGLALATFVISWLTNGKLSEPLTFWTNWSQPWGLVTHPFASTGNGTALFWFLLTLYWLWWVGTSAEVDLGSAKFVGVWIAASIASALFIWIGAVLIYPGLNAPIVNGFGLPVAALTVAWGTRHPDQTILLFGLLPIPGKYLAWLTVALTLFGYGSIYSAPLMGLFASLHLGLAFLFAANRLPFFTYSRYSAVETKVAKKTETMSKEYYDDVKRREKERDERERLRKLFENSINDEPKDS